MNCTLYLTHADGTTSQVNVTPQTPYGRFQGTALGVFYLGVPKTEEFALWLQNGAIDAHGNRMGGGLDFQRLRVEFGQETESVDGRCIRETGTSQTFIQAAPEPHYFPWGAQTVRRFYRRDGIYASVTTESDSGPLKSRWPTLPTSPSFYAKRAIRLRQAILGGQADVGVGIYRNRVGLFFPAGPERPDEPGGADIYFAWGYEQNTDAAFIHRQMMDLSIDRERTACFDAVSGQQITAEDWIARRGSIPDYVETGMPLPDNGPSASPEKAMLVGERFTNFDGEHRIRAYGHAIAAWKQYRDPVAQRFLSQLAHHARGIWCDIGTAGRSLATKIASAQKHPASGTANLSRRAGEIWFLMACARWSGDTSRGIYNCGEAFRKLYELSAMSNGFAARYTYKGSGGGLTAPWDNNLWSTAFDHLQSFEVWILHVGCFAWLAQTVDGFDKPPSRLMRLFGRIPPAAKIMLKATDQLTRNEVLGVWPYQYNKWSLSPPHYVVCADANGAAHNPVHMGGAIISDPTTPKSAIGDPTHLMLGLALAYRMSGDGAYLERIRALDMPQPTLAAKREAFLKSFAQVPGESDYTYQQAEQGRSWNLEALSVIP